MTTELWVLVVATAYLASACTAAVCAAALTVNWCGSLFQATPQNLHKVFVTHLDSCPPPPPSSNVSQFWKIRLYTTTTPLKLYHSPVRHEKDQFTSASFRKKQNQRNCVLFVQSLTKSCFPNPCDSTWFVLSPPTGS